MDEETILRVFPAHFLLISLIAGLSLTYLSPLNLFLPRYMADPFSFTLPSEALSSIVIAVLFSLFIGTPLYFLKYIITGNHGLNHWLRNRSQVKIKGNYEKAESIPDKDLAIYSKWLARKENSGYRDFLQNINCENSIICGFFIGLQLAIILLITSLLVIGVYSLVSSLTGMNSVIPKMLTSGVLEILTRLSVSGFAFFTLWSFNKFYWNRYMSDRVIYVRQSFIAFKEDKM